MQVSRCRWQHRSSRRPEQWVEMNGFGHTYWESDGKGQRGPRWFDTERLKLELIVRRGYHVSLLIKKWTILDGRREGLLCFNGVKSNLKKLHLCRAQM